MIPYNTRSALLSFSTILYVTAAPANPVPCLGDSEFRCLSSSRCIPSTWLCDGARDCEGGEDESEERCHQHDHTRCAGNQPECATADGSFRCILHQWLCDGHPDCMDGSDEKGCETRPPQLPSVNVLPFHPEPAAAAATAGCSSSEFQCASGVCISRDLLCDDTPNCPDGSDESETRCSSPPRVPHPEPAPEREEETTTAERPTSAEQESEEKEDTHTEETRTSQPVGSSKIRSETTSDDRSLPSSATKTSTRLNVATMETVRPSLPPSHTLQSIGTKSPIETDATSPEATEKKSASQDFVPRTESQATAEPESAFQPQIEPMDQRVLPVVGARGRADESEAPPDPFPMDAGKYDAQDGQVYHDDAGTKDGKTGDRTGSKPEVAKESVGSKNEVSQVDNKKKEEVPLSSVLPFMNNQTKSLLKSINATKGHVVRSYKTIMNKTEVQAVSYYKNDRGVFTPLNGNNSAESGNSKHRSRRNLNHENGSIYRNIIGKSKKREAPRKEGTLEAEAIVPIKLVPVSVQEVAPIVPQNKPKEGGNPSENEAPKDPFSENASDRTEERRLEPKEPEAEPQSVPDYERGTGPGPESRAQPGSEPSSKSEPAPRPEAESGSRDGSVTRSERLLSEGGVKSVVKDEKAKEIPSRVDRSNYRDDGEGAIE